MDPFDSTTDISVARLNANAAPRAYNKYDVDPYTKARVILMSAVELEACSFSHDFSRTAPEKIRRELIYSRANECNQRQRLALLVPKSESVIERTIFHELLAVDIAAELSKRATDGNIKAALNRSLAEDFDHLYTFSNLLELSTGVPADKLVCTDILPGKKIMPPRARKAEAGQSADVMTTLAFMIMTAVKQHTTNFYTSACSLVKDDPARRLYAETALDEEHRLTELEGLLPVCSPLERLLWHEYCECYLYMSCAATETDARIKSIWDEHFDVEISHLETAAKLLKKHEKKRAESVIPISEFPPPLSIHESTEYVCDVLASLPDNPTTDATPSHDVIKAHIDRYGRDYRYCKKGPS